MRFATVAAFAAGLFMAAAPAHAITIAGDFDGIEILESEDAFGGAYALVNGSAGASVLGFGVTNPTTTYAFVDVPFDPEFSPPGFDDTGYVTIDGAATVEIWQSVVLTEFDWTTFEPIGGMLGTMQDIFGAWAYGSDRVNWYEVLDANGVEPGQIAEGFGFIGALASQGFGIGSNASGALGSFNAPVSVLSAVPVPAAAWLLLTGVAGMAGMRRLRARA